MIGKIVVLTAACAAMCVASGCGDEGDTSSGESASTGGTYVIGANSGLTGYAAIFDEPALDGLKMAADEINADGGVDGTKIEIISRNNRSQPAQAATTSRELVEEGIDLMIAPCDADLSIPAARITQQAQIPAISPCASTPTIPPAVGDFMFGNMPADNIQGAALAKYAEEQGYETAWLLKSPDTEYTARLPDYFATAFKEKGGEIVGEETYKLGTQDFSPQIDALQELETTPDVIMSSSYEPEFPAFMKQLRAAGVDVPVIESDGIDTATLPEVGSSVNGVVFSTSGFPRDGNALEKFNEAYEKENGHPPDTIFTALGYETMFTIKKAIEDAGSTEGPAVRDAIAALEDFPGVVSPITYAGTDGMPLRSVALVSIAEGKRQFVEEDRPSPEDIPPVE